MIKRQDGRPGVAPAVDDAEGLRLADRCASRCAWKRRASATTATSMEQRGRGQQMPQPVEIVRRPDYQVATTCWTRTWSWSFDGSCSPLYMRLDPAGDSDYEAWRGTPRVIQLQRFHPKMFGIDDGTAGMSCRHPGQPRATSARQPAVFSARWSAARWRQGQFATCRRRPRGRVHHRATRYACDAALRCPSPSSSLHRRRDLFDLRRRSAR